MHFKGPEAQLAFVASVERALYNAHHERAKEDKEDEKNREELEQVWRGIQEGLHCDLERVVFRDQSEGPNDPQKPEDLDDPVVGVGGGDVDDAGYADDKVEDVPRVEEVGVGAAEDDSLSDDLDDRLYDEDDGEGNENFGEDDFYLAVAEGVVEGDHDGRAENQEQNEALKENVLLYFEAEHSEFRLLGEEEERLAYHLVFFFVV